MGMLDPQIREILKGQLISELDSPVLFDELPLCRQGRADIAAVSGSLWGFEIKSAGDSLARLPGQVVLYDQIFDFSVAVVAPKHVSAARRVVPPKWGLATISESLTILHLRKPKPNRKTSSLALIHLLWKSEALALLRRRDRRVSSSAGIGEIWDELQKLPKTEIREGVLAALTARRRCEPVGLRIRGDDSVTMRPMPSSLQDS